MRRGLQDGLKAEDSNGDTQQERGLGHLRIASTSWGLASSSSAVMPISPRKALMAWGREKEAGR